MVINQIMLYALIALTAALLLRGAWRRQDMLRYPFLAAAVMAGWFIPQAIRLSENEALPEGGFALTMLVAILSLGAIVLGERTVQRRPRATFEEYDVRTLSIASVILSGIGIGALYLIFTMNPDASVINNGRSTGIITIYFFFVEFQYYGLAIGLLLLLRKFSWISCSVVAINIWMILSVIIFGGRRGPATELGLIVASAFWFQRRLLPPRMAVVAGFVVVALFVNSAGDYRHLMQSINYRSTEARLPTISEIMQLDFLGTMGSEIYAGSHEVTNAIYDISAASKSDNFDYGVAYWNYLVFRYIPAQIVGKNVKDALTAELPNNASEVYNYIPHIGTTHTGFSDSFSSFWLLGSLVFAMMAAILQKWWRDAMLGDFQAKLFYCVTISVAAEAISHGTSWFFCDLPQVFMCSLPVFYLARKRQPRGDQGRVHESYPVWPRPRPTPF